MKEIQIFKHKMFGAIRTTTNGQGEPLFVGKDVAEAWSPPRFQRTFPDRYAVRRSFGRCCY